jgi:hypothetical protein
MIARHWRAARQKARRIAKDASDFHRVLEDWHRTNFGKSDCRLADSARPSFHLFSAAWRDRIDDEASVRVTGT